MSERRPVCVSLKQLVSGVDEKTLESAFGPESLGIILVSGLPALFQTLRRDVLHSARTLAKLPEFELSKLESAESLWLAGWSRGKEKLAGSGLPDTLKGSYYVNCAFHNDPNLQGPSAELSARFGNEFKTYTTPNIWPNEMEIASLKGFQDNCKQLCNVIIDVAQLVSANCDKYVALRVRNYEPNYLQRVVKNSTCTKARLLYYYPAEDLTTEPDSWCGEHLDHSCLTGLTSGMYFENDKEHATCPDADAGLYIRDRKGGVVKVDIPADCLAFQSGSTLQEVSNGQFKAVPHFVQGSSMPGVARSTLAVFCQPNLDEMVNNTENFAQYLQRILRGNH
jgi:isopenicillin N synthase-like dioxygenase